MNDANVTFRVAPVATVAGLPAGTLAGNGEVRFVTAAGADLGLWICSASTGVWSKAANILMANGTTGVMAGATATIAGLIPAGSLVLGVTCRVTVVIPAPTVTWQCGDGVDADRWGTGLLLPAGTVTTIVDFTIASPVYYAAATNVVMTAVGGNFAGGTIIARVHYLQLGSP